ncbi:Uncharacterised protein [Schaalia odontolytica]|uniref:Uncharacterized protein n=1 Tax=Schaalia odontolytica TaxID=1660 RepID=A0A2X0UDN3_9ACTO|nr:Uncharacterised protein [Schaalia odontolytica]
MVCLNALIRHLQPRAIQAHEHTQISAMIDSIRRIKVFRMDGVGISIIGRPRPLPGHDTPNATHHTYTPNYEKPSNTNYTPNYKEPVKPRLYCAVWATRSI